MNRFHLDNFSGCLVGGAIGDCLGYAARDLSLSEIIDIWGESGLEELSQLSDKIYVSDYTQMSLFTANGILCAMASGHTDELAAYIYAAYSDWLRTQVDDSVDYIESISWLLNIDELHACRYSEYTSLDVLYKGKHGSTDESINKMNSCGGVARVAPIGLFMDNAQDVINCASGAASLTHGHPLAFISAAAFALIISKIIYSEASLENCIFAAIKETSQAFESFPETAEFLQICGKAVKLAALYKGKTFPLKRQANIIASLGTGKTAHEALAISIYCSLMYELDFEKAIHAGVNNSGNSNAVGILTGQILGALNGEEQLPMKYLMGLELYDVISEISGDLYSAAGNDTAILFESDEWKNKYIKHTYL